MALDEGNKRRRAIVKAIREKGGVTVSATLAANKDLTDTEKQFVEARVSGLTPLMAAKVSGLIDPNDKASIAYHIERKPCITEVMHSERVANALAMGFTRQDVLEGLKEAIDSAKILADPAAQIAGWREVAKICGYYAPEIKKIQVSGPAAAKRGELELMSDEQLLELMQQPPIEGESERVQ